MCVSHNLHEKVILQRPAAVSVSNTFHCGATRLNEIQGNMQCDLNCIS